MQEGITYERLAKRVVQQQRQDAASKMLSGGCRQSAVHVQGSAQLQAAGVKPGGTQHAQGACAAPPGADEPLNAGEVPFGASYAQLVAATRSRDAARRAQRAASAAAEPAPRVASAAPAEPVQLPPFGEEEEGQAAEAVAATAADPSPEASWDDGSEALWGDELPLSQVQEAVWKQQLQRHQQQKEQQQPNSQPTTRIAAQEGAVGCSREAAAAE